MKQFDLNEYARLVSEGKTPKVVTRDGHECRIVCTDVNSWEYPILGLVQKGDREFINSFTTNGQFVFNGVSQNNYDLFFSTEPTYRPYKDAEEFLKAQKEHGSHLFACGQYHLPTLVDNECIVTVSISGAVAHRYDEMLGTYIWQDGMPCGVKEE